MEYNVGDILIKEDNIYNLRKGGFLRIDSIENLSEITYSCTTDDNKKVTILESQLDEYVEFGISIVEIVYIRDNTNTELDEYELSVLDIIPEEWIEDLIDMYLFNLSNTLEYFNEGMESENIYLFNSNKEESNVLDIYSLTTDDVCDLNDEDRIYYLRTSIDLALTTGDKDWFLELTKELIELENM